MLSYLFVVPVYLLVLAAAVVAGVICLFIPNARHASAYFFAGAVGSVPGMIIANAILILVVVVLARNAGSYPEGAPYRQAQSSRRERSWVRLSFLQ